MELGQKVFARLSCVDPFNFLNRLHRVYQLQELQIYINKSNLREFLKIWNFEYVQSIHKLQIINVKADEYIRLENK